MVLPKHARSIAPYGAETGGTGFERRGNSKTIESQCDTLIEYTNSTCTHLVSNSSLANANICKFQLSKIVPLSGK